MPLDRQAGRPGHRFKSLGTDVDGPALVPMRFPKPTPAAQARHPHEWPIKTIHHKKAALQRGFFAVPGTCAP
jgi:hypothetical protein